MFKLNRLCLSLLVAGVMLAASACTPQDKDAKGSAAASSSDLTANNEGIKSASRILFGGREPLEIRDSVIPGLKEIIISDGVFYASPDGKYFMQGEIHEIATQRNLSAEALDTIRKTVAPEIKTDEAITYKAKNQKYEVSVFTDITCVYCHKLHEEIKAYNDLGVTVHYYPWPRDGDKGQVFTDMTSVWCAKDKNKALDDAMAGKPVKAASCDFPMGKYLDIGRRMLIRGTPGMFAMNGVQLGGGGYIPSADLVKAIEEAQAK